jgi:hypothetical protein
MSARGQGRGRAATVAGVAAVAVVLVGAPVAAGQQPGFDHVKHQKLFPTCTTCHAGAAQAGAPLWPDPASCAPCHDGKIAKPVQWRPPTEPARSNLKFDHARHAAKVARAAVRGGATAAIRCVDCHSAQGAAWMVVKPPLPERCLDCHGVRTAHLAAPDTACATCHLPLAEAKRLTARDVAAFEVPPDHRQPGFAGGEGHGTAAKAGSPVAASCATCHARDFCLQCHVDAPEQRTIQALAPDPRSRAIVAQLKPPASHADPAFLATHGATTKRTPGQCSSCHTRESCLACHADRPQFAAKLPAAGAGRGTGASVTRRPPPSHGEGFIERHAALARAVPATCAGCHVRADCLECHRPDAARASGYHPAGFLTQHPAAAYARETSCSDCHNAGQFCTSCHARSGLTARGPLRSGYHDANQFFIVGHGGAARQSLESCVSCHIERDCLTCHSALGGRHFDPHGPGFDPNRLIKKNPQVCTACHGTNIPTR